MLLHEVRQNKDTEDHFPAPPSALNMQVSLVWHSSFKERPQTKAGFQSQRAKHGLPHLIYPP